MAYNNNQFVHQMHNTYDPWSQVAYNDYTETVTYMGQTLSRREYEHLMSDPYSSI